jgi:methionyl aminopeptidase
MPSMFKNRTDLQNLQEAGRIAAVVCDELIAAAKPGVSTVKLEALANRLLQLNRSSAPFKSFDGFNHAMCISLNGEVVNGPPSRERILTEGDLVSIATGSCYRDVHGKAARTAYLGEPSPDIARLLKGTRAAIDAMIAISKASPSIKSLVTEIAKTAEAYDLRVIEGTGGCCIGRQLHEFPMVPNNLDALKDDTVLVPGMALSLMPMMTLGDSGAWEMHEDGWTQMTRDGDLAAHFAETVLMTDSGLIILTQAEKPL